MTTPTHLDTDQPEWAGAGGLAVHGVTALLVVCRLLPHVCTRRPRGEARRDDGGGDDDLEGSGCPRPAVAPLNKRKAFHIVLFLAVACDTPHVWMCRGTVDVPAEAWVYSFHLLSYSLFFVAYSLVVMTWARVFAVGERRTSVAWGVSVGNALYAICSAYAIVRLWSAPSVAVFVNDKLLLVVYSVATMLVTISLVGCGTCALRRLLGHSGWAKMEAKRRRQGMMLMVGVMGVCAVCFTLRAILIVLLLQYIDVHGSMSFSTMPKGLWYVGAHWAPRLLPTLCMLFIMRRTGRATLSAPIIPSLRNSPSPYFSRRGSSYASTAPRRTASGHSNSLLGEATWDRSRGGSRASDTRGAAHAADAHEAAALPCAPKGSEDNGRHKGGNAEARLLDGRAGEELPLLRCGQNGSSQLDAEVREAEP